MKYIYFFIIIFICNLITGQTPNFSWAKSTGSSISLAITVDPSGNVYTTGYFNGLVDFDPGPGVFNVSGNLDIFILKLDVNGNFVWAKSLSGANYWERGTAIKVDGSGNVYTAGYFKDIVDFDPGPAVYNLTSLNNNTDVFISKLDPFGNFIWAKSFGANGDDKATAIALDGNKNVYTVGTFSSTVDFDTGPGTYTVASQGWFDGFIHKLDSSGIFIWVKKIGGIGTDEINSIDIDPSGNMALAGSFQGTVDMDPGVGAAIVSSFAGSSDIFVSKFNSLGSFQWVSVCGAAANDVATCVKFDPYGNVISCGGYAFTVDFDASPGIYTVTAVGSFDNFISKLDFTGSMVWTKSIGGLNADYMLSLSCDLSGNIYTTGYFAGTVDFDPGPAIYNLTAPSDDIFLSKVNPAGSFEWAILFGGALQDVGEAIQTDALGNVHLTGYFSNSPDFDPGPGIFNLTSVGGSDQFVLKLCQAYTPVITPSGTLSFCQGNNVILNCSPANSYSWNTGATTQSILVTNQGNYSVTTTNINGCASASSVIPVTVFPLPTVSVNSGTICAGSSFTLVPTGANTYSFSSPSQVVTPTINSSYSVVGTSSNGCVSSNTAISSVFVNVNPTITINATSNSVCIGTSATLSAIGADIYSWSFGPTSPAVIISPTSTTNYLVVGTNTLTNCSDSKTIALIVDSPTVLITGGPTTVCSGSSVNLTASGANTYTWSTGDNGANIINNPISFTTISVTGTTSAGCIGTATMNISVLSLPSVSISGSFTSCAGQSATLIALGSISYTWSNSLISNSIVVSPSVTTNYSVITIGLNGCYGSAAADVYYCTNIDEIKRDLKMIKVYPNPTRGLINVILEENNLETTLTLYNALGQIILIKKINGPSTINIDELPVGIYSILFSRENDFYALRIIKE